MGENYYTIKEIPEYMRPREAVERIGIRNVDDEVLLAIILRSGVRGRNVIDLARGLLVRFGSLRGIEKAGVNALSKVKGVGKIKAQVISASLELARRLAREEVSKSIKIKKPADVAEIIREDVRGLEQEKFFVLHLDIKNQLKNRPQVVTVGLLNASLAHCREIFRQAVKDACASIILVHNHPSGDPAPSREDINITKRLVECGQILDIKVLDHVIIGNPDRANNRKYCSLREDGIVSFEK